MAPYFIFLWLHFFIWMILRPTDIPEWTQGIHLVMNRSSFSIIFRLNISSQFKLELIVDYIQQQ